MISEIDRWAALCDDSSTIDEKIKRYEDFYEKPCAMLSQLRPYPVSQLMNLDEICEVSPDFLNSFYYPVNPQNRVTALIREKESSSAYLDEALVLSVPTKMLISRFKKMCESHIPAAIASLTVADVDKSGHVKRNISDNDVKQSDKLIDCVKLRDQDRDVSTLTNFLFAFEDNNKKLKDFIMKMTDEFNAIGYNYVQTTVVNNAYIKQPFTDKIIKVVFIQFEAKYSDFPFKMSDVLYHVVPNRYMKKIVKNGLVPCSKSNAFKYPDRVYLFNFDKMTPKAQMLSEMYNYCFNKVLYLKELQLSTSSDADAQSIDDGFYILHILKDKLEKHPLFLAKHDAPKMKVSHKFFSKKIQIHDYQRMDFFIDPQFNTQQDDTSSSHAIFTYANIPRELIENDAQYIKINWRKTVRGKLVGTSKGISDVNLNDIK